MLLLTPNQTAALRAAVDRILPPDEFPGGWEAGVGDYLLRQLGPDGDLQRLLPVDRTGLDALDAEARAGGGTGFADLDATAQDALLARLEAGRAEAPAAWGKVEPALFFRRLVEHSMEGFYGDPGNGGNKNGAAWDMIGFRVRG